MGGGNGGSNGGWVEVVGEIFVKESSRRSWWRRMVVWDVVGMMRMVDGGIGKSEVVGREDGDEGGGVVDEVGGLSLGDEISSN